MIDYSRKCSVCGAAVRNMNPRTTTCDPVCTRAKHNKVTRVDQIKLDLKEDDRRELERLSYEK